jgi:hypothetical protein
MTGRTRLPAGEPRKASQRRIRRGEPMPTRMMPQWRNGDRIRWHDKAGVLLVMSSSLRKTARF